MRLVNARFGEEVSFFWDERADVLEDQTTMPIQDHVEMGFSGSNGDPTIENLIASLEELEYYPPLFELAFGDVGITEERISMALAQFVRSIQSFDSKFDEGLAMVNNINAPFPNYSPQENAGKNLFINPPQLGGAGCQGCHRAPEFDIDPDAMNNGVIGVIGYPDSVDLTNTRAPSLRELFTPDGSENGPFMHDASMETLLDVINHYDHIVFNPQVNPNLDQRLRGAPPGLGQNLGLTENEKQNLIAFLRTLSGGHIYSEEAYSDPFDQNGNIDIIGLSTGVTETGSPKVDVYPNPVSTLLTVTGPAEGTQVSISDLSGKVVVSGKYSTTGIYDFTNLSSGVYLVSVSTIHGQLLETIRVLKVD